LKEGIYGRVDGGGVAKPAEGLRVVWMVAW